MVVVSGSVTVALAFGVLAGTLPVAAVGRRAALRDRARASCWPDAVDDLASAVRAGMALPEGVAALAERGPEALRPAFARFAAEHRVTGSFGVSLDLLKDDLADPVGDRVVEALRLAREVGGSDLGRLLRTLSAVLREDARTRAELQARQAWAVSAARLAVAAPWATLAFLSLRPGALAAYDSAGGVLVLLTAGGLSAVAYVVMRRIGRLPVDERVLA
jgi:tight adherence protein B